MMSDKFLEKSDRYMKKQSHSYIAFFDVDETIISIKSMFSFLQYSVQCSPFFYRLKNYFKYTRQINLMKKMSLQGRPRSEVNIQYYRYYKGIDKNVLKNLGARWHLKCLQEIEGFYHESILNEIAFHKKKGAKIVLVSGSFFACLEPIAKHVQADDILATSLEIINDKCTGKLLSYPVIGEGKARAIQTYMKGIEYLDCSSCYAYGDHITDLSMLNSVGNPVVIEKCHELLSHAKQNNWRIISALR